MMRTTPAWVLDKLEARAAEVASVELGTGSNRPANSALYRASFLLGQLVPHLIDRPTVANRLFRAATTDRHPAMRPAEAERTIDQGLDAGMANPWHPKSTTRTSPMASARTAKRSDDPKEPPKQSEVVALWNGCVSVLEDDEVCAWLRSRKIDPVRVDADNLALALPKTARDLPRWAKSKIGDGWASWAASGHRLVLPLVDVQGKLRSVLARDVTERHREKKSLSPLGHARKGFFMRDPAARLVLWPEQARDDVPELAGPERWHDDAPERRIVIVEGEKKYLQVATYPSDADPHAPATIGIFSGSWTDELAALIPNGWHVRIEVDPDGIPEGPGAGGGARYATTILRSLVQRHEAGTVRIELRREFVVRQGRYGLVVHVAEEAQAS